MAFSALQLGDLPGSGMGLGVEHTLRSADARERLRCLAATRGLFECRVSVQNRQANPLPNIIQYAQFNGTLEAADLAISFAFLSLSVLGSVNLSPRDPLDAAHPAGALQIAVSCPGGICLLVVNAAYGILDKGASTSRARSFAGQLLILLLPLACSHELATSKED